MKRNLSIILLLQLTANIFAFYPKSTLRLTVGLEKNSFDYFSFARNKYYGGLLLATNDDELDQLRINESTLSDSEKDRLNRIKKISLEADEMIKAAGFNILDQDEDEVQKSIKETQWSGQSNAEQITLSTNTWNDLKSRFGLAVGDVSALVAFASIGRNNHGEGLDLVGLSNTAFPFVFSWLLISPLLGAYARSATATKGSIISGLLPGWSASLFGALAIRGLLKGSIPPVPFVIVSLTATFVLLYAWRWIYISVFGETADGEFKKAGAFEVFKMIGTLIKRW
eukprot:gene13062-17506_t